ncbi:hypothetical protein H5410_028119 [Solanum commersonii]|uniref:Uncharacterized protein n=1 Tax=Solanum commersonii TaxID=4109 RepID=A0A9J5Z117_SOLCO|nr:hypothetical protein H5410_028119 [Solanum commersonii]
MVTREEFTMQRIKKLEEQLQKVCELMIKEADGEGSTSNAPQPIVETMVPIRNNFEGPRDVYPLLFSQMFPPLVPQLFYPMPQHMAVGKPPGLTLPMPSTIMDSLIPSPMMDSMMPSPTIDSSMP